MRTIPQCYYHQSVLDFIKDKIDYDQIYSFNDLDEIDKDRLTAICIDRLSNDAYEVLIQSDGVHNTINHLKKFLLTHDIDETYQILAFLRKNAIETVSGDMNDLFNQLYHDRLSA